MKKLLALCLSLCLIITMLPSYSKAALSDVGDAVSQGVPVTLSVPTNPEITVSIPASIDVTYDEGKGMYYGEGFISAKGNALEYTRIKVQNRTKENKVLTLETDDEKVIKGNLIFGDYEGKELWHAADLQQGINTPENPVTKKVAIEVPATNGFRKGDYTTIVDFDVELETDYITDISGGKVKVGGLTFNRSNIDWYIDRQLDNTGTGISRLQISYGATGAPGDGASGALGSVFVPLLSIPSINDLKGCVFNEGFLTYRPSSVTLRLDTVNSIVVSETFRYWNFNLIKGDGCSNNLAIYIPRNTTILADTGINSGFETVKVYYGGTVIDYMKHYKTATLNCDVDAFKNYVTTNGTVPTITKSDGSAPATNVVVYCLNDNFEWVEITPEMINALP